MAAIWAVGSLCLGTATLWIIMLNQSLMHHFINTWELLKSTVSVIEWGTLSVAISGAFSPPSPTPKPPRLWFHSEYKVLRLIVVLFGPFLYADMYMKSKDQVILLWSSWGITCLAAFWFLRQQTQHFREQDFEIIHHSVMTPGIVCVESQLNSSKLIQCWSNSVCSESKVSSVIHESSVNTNARMSNSSLRGSLHPSRFYRLNSCSKCTPASCPKTPGTGSSTPRDPGQDYMVVTRWWMGGWVVL